MSESVIPAVLLRALGEYKYPLWRMADGKIHARVELTFHKTLPRLPVYKKRAESWRQPASSADEWPRQSTGARRPPPPTTRPPPTARWQPTTPEKETSLPAKTLQIVTQTTITLQRSPKTAQITPLPNIQKPATPPSSPESPRAKKPRIKSPKYTRQPTQYFHVKMENDYPIHEKYDLQDVHATTYKVIVEATRQPSEEGEINIDLPAFFVYHRENKHWLLTHQRAHITKKTVI